MKAWSPLLVEKREKGLWGLKEPLRLPEDVWYWMEKPAKRLATTRKGGSDSRGKKPGKDPNASEFLSAEDVGHMSCVCLSLWSPEVRGSWACAGQSLVSGRRLRAQASSSKSTAAAACCLLVV